MPDLKNKFKRIKRAHLQIAGVLFVILLAILLIWFNESNSTQSNFALVADVYFEGEYRIADGEWRPIVDGEHIPSTKGDVTLRGNFHLRAPDGTYEGIYREPIPVAFYTNHINVTIIEGEYEPIVLDTENPIFGKTNCGENWEAYELISEPNEMIQIVIHNPHSFGNETAIDEMLSTTACWTLTLNNNFENSILDSGETERNVGLLFVMVSIMVLGIALFSSLIHIKNSKTIWVLGSLILFAGIYFAYNAEGVSFWGASIASNTTLLGASMMFYMFFLVMIIVRVLTVTGSIGRITVMLLGVADAVFLILPISPNVFFYDTWIWWIAVQMAVNVVIAACLVKELFVSKEKFKWVYIGAFLPLIAFAVDVIGVWLGIYDGAPVSQCVFTVMFAIAMIMVLKLIPHNINAATKAKELEMEKIALNAELAESRISTMMSQIRPHFIYNTLGSIEQLCELDPPKAGELVHDFAKYLRGNFGELDNPKPILMSQEMDHVRHYVSIENVRFPDMTFSFEMNSDDFHIPALTIQPIVENAIKHGLMRLQKGGAIQVVSYETEDHYCVSVTDDGAGFDTNLLLDERKHVGLRNIRERLMAMVGGTLEIESTVDVGTKVLIKIPKEWKK